MKMWIDKNLVIVEVKYNRQLVEQLKAIGGGRWQVDQCYWTFPLHKFDALKDLKFNISKDSKSIEERLFDLNAYMILKGYSIATNKSYFGHLKRFLEYANNQFWIDEVNDYIRLLVVKHNCSYSYTNQAISAIKLYARISRQISIDDIEHITRGKKEKTLPKVMTQDQVQRIFNNVSNEKYRTAVMLAYSAGLRVSEVASLQIGDIDSEQMLIHVKRGKGKKDRETLLSNKMLSQLKEFYLIYRPEKFIFENPMRDGHITTRTLQKAFVNSRIKSKLHPRYTFHSLRHSFATHLLESGVAIIYIQELLGHSSSRTTEVYTHVSTSQIRKIVNPLDQL